MIRNCLGCLFENFVCCLYQKLKRPKKERVARRWARGEWKACERGIPGPHFTGQTSYRAAFQRNILCSRDPTMLKVKLLFPHRRIRLKRSKHCWRDRHLANHDIRFKAPERKNLTDDFKVKVIINNPFETSYSLFFSVFDMYV